MKLPSDRRTFFVGFLALVSLAFLAILLPFYSALMWAVILAMMRSEEHTSDSSHLEISYAVFCLKTKMRDMGAMGYLDDEGFCRSYIEKYYECGRGLIRIRQELVSKRKADPFMVDKVFEECDFPLSEHERAEELTEKSAKIGRASCRERV